MGASLRDGFTKDHASPSSGNRLRKILLIRAGRVGDMVMLTPAVQAVLDHHPHAEVHLLTSRDGQRVFRDYSPRLRMLLYDRHALMAGFSRLTLLKQVRAASYDLACCFELNPSFAAFASAAARGVGIADHSRDECYAQRCLEVVWRALGRAPERDYRISLPVTAEARERARLLYAQAGIPPAAYVVGIHPTYSGLHRAWRRRRTDAGRRWPEESFAELARGLFEEGVARGLDLRVVMDLLPQEVAFGERIVRLSGGIVTMMAPPPDFQRYKAVLERMDMLITTDTGAMHVAGAVGTRLVSLFGMTDPASSCAYVPPEQCIEVHSPSGMMTDITPAEVLAACRRFLPSDVRVAAAL